MTDGTTVEGLDNAVKLLSDRRDEAQLAIKTFEENCKELTGYPPNQPINALDVVKIVARIWGEPK